MCSSDLEHVEAQHEVERAGRDLRLERRLRGIAAPDAIETRVSLQIYNEHDDVKRLADAVNRLP